MEKIYKPDYRQIKVAELFFSLENNTAPNIRSITGYGLKMVNNHINKAIDDRFNLKNMEVIDFEIL